ncbi:energy transducer TonB [Thalassotalea sp. 1_MG-2023]|uniref:energy transducer TonB n=1 Tax=Thalassotalea sp. 1_MG-2023 TaxID=3062680 RepID=UPI0026E2629F|nr:energy transducer TonB [Thalassotalea sp. 1_MG-2023]MDO6428607.1 energy transducer TonB [Thalassotalea sp. 1_MG-2023]
MFLRKKLSSALQWVFLHKSWLIAFSVVMLLHTVAIASMMIFEEQEIKPIAAPPSAIVVSFIPPSQTVTPNELKVPKKVVEQQVDKPQPELITAIEADNGQHIVKETPQTDNINETKKTINKEQNKPHEETSEEPTENVVKATETNIFEAEPVDDVDVQNANSANMQVSLKSDIQPNNNAVAKNKDELAMAQWQHKVQAHLERLKRYPLIALKQKRQGVVTVHFKINRQGDILDASLAEPSGVHLLDRATLTLIAQAGPLPKPPAHLSKKPLSVVVPIRYQIR